MQTLGGLLIMGASLGVPEMKRDLIRQDALISQSVEDWDESDRVDAVYEAGLECASKVLEDDTAGVYALYRWDHAYTVTLPDRHLDPKFCEQHPGLELLETYEASSWDDAVAFLHKREIEFYQPNDPLRDEAEEDED